MSEFDNSQKSSGTFFHVPDDLVIEKGPIMQLLNDVYSTQIQNLSVCLDYKLNASYGFCVLLSDFINFYKNYDQINSRGKYDQEISMIDRMNQGQIQNLIIRILEEENSKLFIYNPSFKYLTLQLIGNTYYIFNFMSVYIEEMKPYIYYIKYTGDPKHNDAFKATIANVNSYVKNLKTDGSNIDDMRYQRTQNVEVKPKHVKPSDFSVFPHVPDEPLPLTSHNVQHVGYSQGYVPQLPSGLNSVLPGHGPNPPPSINIDYFTRQYVVRGDIERLGLDIRDLLQKINKNYTPQVITKDNDKIVISTIKQNYIEASLESRNEDRFIMKQVTQEELKHLYRDRLELRDAKNQVQHLKEIISGLEYKIRTNDNFETLYERSISAEVELKEENKKLKDETYTRLEELYKTRELKIKAEYELKSLTEIVEDLNRVNSENNERMKPLLQIEGYNIQLHAIIQSLENKNSEKDKIIETKSKVIDETNMKLQSKTQEFDDTNKQLQDKTKELENINIQLQSKTQEYDDTTKQLEVKSKELQVKTQEIKELQRQLENKSKEYDDTMKHLYSKTKELQDTQRQLEDKSKEFDDIKKHLQELQKQIEVRNIKLQELSLKLQDYNIIKSDIEHYKQHVERLNLELQEQSKINERINQDKNKATTELINVNSKISKYTIEIQDLGFEKEQLKEQNKNNSDIIEKLNIELRELKDKYKKVKQQIQTVQQKQEIQPVPQIPQQTFKSPQIQPIQQQVQQQTFKFPQIQQIQPVQQFPQQQPIQQFPQQIQQFPQFHQQLLHGRK